MHRRDDPAPRQKRPQDREQERRHDERQIPDTQRPAPLLYPGGVQKRGRREPRKEGRVLHRIPGPVSAPPEYLVGPPHSRDDREREKAPGGNGPAPRDPDPGGIRQPSAQEGTDREGEGHGEAHESEVEQRGMDRHQDVILQQRVGARAVDGNRHDGPEGIRRQQQKKVEERAHTEQRRHGVRHQRSALFTVQVNDRRGVPGKYPRPEKYGALEGSPERDYRVEQRRGPATDLGHVRYAEVPDHQRVDHRQIRDGHEYEDPERGQRGAADQPGPLP